MQDFLVVFILFCAIQIISEYITNASCLKCVGSCLVRVACAEPACPVSQNVSSHVCCDQRRIMCLDVCQYGMCDMSETPDDWYMPWWLELGLAVLSVLVVSAIVYYSLLKCRQDRAIVEYAQLDDQPT